jgi:uncharacterized protein (DUF1684 family)
MHRRALVLVSFALVVLPGVGRCHQADVRVFSDETFAACASALAGQLALYRKDMEAAARRAYDNADAIENARNGRMDLIWDGLKLQAAAADLRNKTQVLSQRKSYCLPASS